MLHNIKQVFIGGTLTLVVLAGCAREAETSPETVSLLKKVAELEVEVAGLESREEIKEVYVRYGRGVDRLDEEQLPKFILAGRSD